MVKKSLYLCILALATHIAHTQILPSFSGEKLPTLTEYCQIEGVVIEKTGATIFRRDRGHFSEIVTDISLDDIDFSNTTQYEDLLVSLSTHTNVTRRIYHADTHTEYTWNAESCSLNTTSEQIPRYVEIYNSIVKKYYLGFEKTSTDVGGYSFDLYVSGSFSGLTACNVIVNPYTKLPYSIIEYKFDSENPTSSEVVFSAIFSFLFPDSIDSQAFYVNSTNICWKNPVLPPTNYPLKDKCTVYEPPEEEPSIYAYTLPPIPSYCTYSMNASGTYKANAMSYKINNKLDLEINVQNGNCFNKMETTTENGTAVTVQGIYHYGSNDYYSMTLSSNGQFTGTCSKKSNYSLADANPIVEYYNKAMNFFGKSFALSEDIFNNEKVDVYTYENNIIRVSKNTGFPVYIKYSYNISILLFDMSFDVLFEDIKASMENSANSDFDVPVIEGCAEWSEKIVAPVVEGLGDLNCTFYVPPSPAEGSGEGSDASGNSGENKVGKDDGAFTFMPLSVLFLFLCIFVLF